MDVRTTLKRIWRSLTTRIYYGFAKFDTIELACKGSNFNVEVADTRRKIRLGLMYRRSMLADHGMLFAYTEDRKHGIWMFNTRFPLDILWLDKSKAIVHILKGAEPCRSIFDCQLNYPNSDARYVVEFNAGTADRIGLRKADKVSFSLDNRNQGKGI